jgi:hypothetical protein
VDRAREILCLTPPIGSEVAKFGLPYTPLLIGQPKTAHVAKGPPPAGGPVRLVVTGRPYEGGSNLLGDACLAWRAAGRPVDVVYIGSHYAALPPAVRPLVRDLGFVEDDDAFRRALADCHVAFLTGPDALDAFGRYSFPSRVGDLLMAGLPVLSACPAGSATAGMLAPITPAGVRAVGSGADIVAALDAFTSTAQGWAVASRSARTFAEGHLSIDVIRARMVQVLERASGGPAVRAGGG